METAAQKRARFARDLAAHRAGAPTPRPTPAKRTATRSPQRAAERIERAAERIADLEHKLAGPAPVVKRAKGIDLSVLTDAEATLVTTMRAAQVSERGIVAALRKRRAGETSQRPRGRR